jgi:hypothetical protein
MEKVCRGFNTQYPNTMLRSVRLVEDGNLCNLINASMVVHLGVATLKLSMN